ncbi:MAG TPA: histidine kinase [Pseudonocardiaceae bacterium]|nr:histidine kinase [Pseudonocardiaceae bacterium]
MLEWHRAQRTFSPVTAGAGRPVPGGELVWAGTLFYVTGLQELFSVGAPTVALWQRLVVLAVGCLAVAARRRAPLPCLGLAVLVVIVDGMSGFSLPVVLVLIEALHNATLRGSQQVSRAILCGTAVTTLAAMVGAGVAAGNWRVGAVAAVQAGTVLLLPVWWAMEVRQHRDRAKAERRNAQQQARIAELDRRAALSAERARMARDLHDVIAGHLSAIALQSEAVLSMAGGDPATARTVLASVRHNSVQSLVEMKAMIDLLRAEETDPHTAPARLADLEPLLDSARAAGLEVTAQAELTRQLPAAVDLTAYRIVQESLTNAVKHAAGSSARVIVRREDDVVVVEVTNNLTAPPGAAEGTGLVSMRERATALGGTLTAGLSSGRWRVHAVLPTGER